MKIHTEGTHFYDENGKPFVPVGTTCYAILYQSPKRIRETLTSIFAQAFNKVRFCIFPKNYPQMVGEPPYFPFEGTPGHWDIHKPNEEFWTVAESVVQEMGQNGVVCDIILFHPYDEGKWGFDRLSMKENYAYLDYVFQRLGKYDHVWWSLANEYDFVVKKSMRDWKKLEKYIATHDTNRHLLSCHNGLALWDSRKGYVTHASVQTVAVRRTPDLIMRYRKPVIIDECCYEGNLPEHWGDLSGKELTRRFWQACACGGYCTHGETFVEEDGYIFWAMGGTLHGESLSRIAFLKEILEGLPGPLTYFPAWGPLAQMTSPLMDKLLQHRFSPNGLVIAAIRKFAPENISAFIASAFMMDAEDAMAMKEQQIVFAGHVEEEAYLIYYDIRTCGKDVLLLPEGKNYKIEYIDTWNMTREVLSECASGKTEITLPATEYMAVLATRI